MASRSPRSLRGRTVHLFLSGLSGPSTGGPTLLGGVGAGEIEELSQNILQYLSVVSCNFFAGSRALLVINGGFWWLLVVFNDF